MRIAVWHNLPSGGGKRALSDHVRGLVARGHDIEVWCPSWADESYLPLSTFVKVHILPMPSLPSPPRVLRSLRAEAAQLRFRWTAIQHHCREAAAAINAGGFDVVFQNSCQLTGSAPLAKHLKIPSVLYLQEPYRAHHEAMPEPPFAALPEPGRSRLAPWYVRQRIRDHALLPVRREMVREEARAAATVNRLLVNSHYSRESVLRAYGVHSRVCYLGIDLMPTVLQERRGLIGVGSIHALKNIDFVLRAIALMTAPKPRLLWIGNAADINYRKSLEDLAKTLNVDLVLKVMVSDDELQRELASAVALAYAPRLEPFGYAPLEANAQGTPVVTVVEAGLRETVLDDVNGLMTEPTLTAFAQALDRIVTDTSLARRLGETGRERVQTHWGMPAALDRLEGHLQDVAREKML